MYITNPRLCKKNSSLAWEAIDSKASGSSIWSRPMALLLHHRRMVITRAVAELFGGFTERYVFSTKILQYVFLFHLNFASKMHSKMHSSSENTLEQGKETFKVSSPSTSQLLFMSMSVPHMHTKMARWFTWTSGQKKDWKHFYLKTNKKLLTNQTVENHPLSNLQHLSTLCNITTSKISQGHYQCAPFRTSSLPPKKKTSHEPLKKTSYFPLYLFLNGNPYNGLF